MQSALLFLAAVLAAVSQVTAASTLEAWFLQNGGYLSDKILVTGEGVFAKEDISMKELLLEAPPSTLLGAAEDFEHPLNCQAIQNFLHESRLGEASNYAPLIDSLPPLRLPNLWSDAAQELLEAILGRDEEGQDLPPMGATWYLEANYEDCPGSSESDLPAAAYFYQQSVIVPFMNFFNHRNGHYTNVDFSPLLADQSIQFRATQDIAQGSELYLSLNQCKYCHDELYGTPELFRDYGFIEDFPQRWTFPGIDLVADIDIMTDRDGNALEGLEVYWASQGGEFPSIEALEEYFLELDQMAIAESGADVPEEEMELIIQYHAALTIALEAVIDNMADDEEYIGPPMENEYTGEYKELVQWFVDLGGFLNPKLEIRSVDPSNPSSRKGIFAKEDLGPNEMLLFVPRSAALEPSDKTDASEEALDCETVNVLLEHMELGDSSEYAPFVRYLVDSYASVPSAWSKEGQDLLIDILGMEIDQEVIPPYDSITWILREWVDECMGPDVPEARMATLITVGQGWDSVFIPIYGIFSHKNGYELNTRSSGSIFSNNEIVLRSSKNVKAGDELHVSRNLCTECGQRRINYGTPEIFRDYGEVEDYPRRYNFAFHDLAFEIDHALDKDGRKTGDLVATILFDSAPVTEESIAFLSEELQRLQTFADFEWKFIKHVPEPEKTAIGKLLDAYLKDFPVVLHSLTGELDESCTGTEECSVKKAFFSPLEPVENDVFERTICNINAILRFDNWEDTDQCQSLYQKMTFSNDLANNNTCFDLDHTVQICSDYRPQYHELQVQYAARFLEDIRRVIWVGGGDSMLLQEILKYPNLELGVGLELDQNVTRMSFKHFGTQPHWDDERVEWWFGDASKSLLMLPKSYFGSFDMVLVDLSETVMSFKVTNELDIVEALSLLMKPGGIFVKNEFYFEKMSSIFKHVVQIYVSDVPVICQQAMSFGSNQVDFLEKFRHATDHGVETLYVVSEEDTDKIMHDYALNETASRIACSSGAENTISSARESQERSPGILMVLEVEDYSETDFSVEQLKSSLISLGFDVEETLSQEKFVVFIMKQGYVSVRRWAEYSYCAVDILLWSEFDKHPATKKAILDAVKGTIAKSSSFRVVTGGMFGVATWREDEAKRGPDELPRCESDADSPSEASSLPLSSNDLQSVISESLALVSDDKLNLVVVCGPRDSCHAEKTVKKSERVANVVTLYLCPEIENINEFYEGASEKIASCRKSLSQQVRDAVLSTGKMRGVIIDPSAPYVMGQITHSIFSSKVAKASLLTEAIFMVAPLVGEDTWRHLLLDQFRVQVTRFNPNFTAKLKISGTEHRSSELSLLSSGDDAFWFRLMDVVEQLRSTYGVKIYEVLGGKEPYQPNYSPPDEKYFHHRDYNQTAPLGQFMSQEATGLQAIIQMEHEHAVQGMMKVDLLEVFSKILNQMELSPETIQEYSSFGEGEILVATYESGSTILLWDGRAHVDVNLFSYEQDDKIVSTMESLMKENVPGLFTVLRDFHPRGYGRNVNWSRDVSPRVKPHWAY